MTDTPWFSFYASDFLAGTVDFSPLEVTAYIRLLCHQWGKGSVPLHDYRRLCQITGLVPDELDEVLPMVHDKFPGGRNPRLEREREKREQQREAGSKGGRAKAKRSGRASERASETRSETRSETPSERASERLAPQPQLQPEYSSSKNTERENARALAEGEIPRQLETLKSHLGTVRRGWSVEFGADEREALIRQGYLAALLSLSDDDWQAMGEMLGSSQKAADRREALKIGMPNRRTLITNTADWLSNLERYQARHKRATVAARAPAVPDYEPTDEEREQMRRMIAESLKA